MQYFSAMCFHCSFWIFCQPLVPFPSSSCRQLPPLLQLGSQVLVAHCKTNSRNYSTDQTRQKTENLTTFSEFSEKCISQRILKISRYSGKDMDKSLVPCFLVHFVHVTHSTGKQTVLWFNLAADVIRHLLLTAYDPRQSFQSHVLLWTTLHAPYH